MFPLNPAVKAPEPTRAKYVDTGVGMGPLTTTLGDGQVLKGTYRVAAYDVEGGIQFVVTGSKSKMLCRGIGSADGHGHSKCETDAGALWEISW